MREKINYVQASANAGRVEAIDLGTGWDVRQGVLAVHVGTAVAANRADK